MVYGHVMTNCGNRILIQITFDVMNVRKPLLSTSALKHPGVTIIFNDDYDRIMFRNEIVNLVSHECHSYLHVILTNGIPPCKELVMAGERATNDVDGEVYDNDGNERNEAREASAGDRRAIADADQAGQLDISGEQDSGYTAEIPDRLHVHSNSGREQNSAMYHIRGNARWSGDQLHVRSERRLRGSDEGNPATF